MSKIIILRGNSGSGKTTVSKAMQRKFGRGTMLIPQDYVRREMLWVNDKPGYQAVGLVNNLVTFGCHNCDFVILEGILYSETYKSLFDNIEEIFAGKIYAYYFDLSFEETLRRHNQKPIMHEYGETEMRSWWREKDFLPNICEKVIDEKMSLDEIVEMVYDDVMKKLNITLGGPECRE